MCVLTLCISAPVGAASGGGRRAIRFEEVGAKAGVRVRHHTRTFHGKNAGILHMFTSGGAAVAVGDYDGDGYEDIFVTDSDIGKPNHLFHNNGVHNNGVHNNGAHGGTVSFTDVAMQAGVAGGNDATAIVSDALWFDYDNDGKLDLLVTRFGTPILYHNEGNGRFKDVTASSGLNKFANTIACRTGASYSYSRWTKRESATA